MLICRKTTDGATDLDRGRAATDLRIRLRSASSRQGGPVFLPRRKLSAIGEAVLLGNHQHLPRMDDVAADPVGALQR